LNKGLLTSEQI